MASLLNSLKAISRYPIPSAVVEEKALARNLAKLDSEITSKTLNSREYLLVRADLLGWVSLAPNITQGGISYNVLSPDRDRMREEANRVYGELDDPAYRAAKKVRFGYKGSRL